MSENLRALAIAAYKSSAAAAYQHGSKLRSRVMQQTGVMAEHYNFPVFGVSDAGPRGGSSQDVRVNNTGNKRPTATLTPWESWDYLDRQDQALTNVNTMQSYGKIHGSAVSRQFDQPIMHALANYDANAYSREGLAANNKVDASAAKFSAAHIGQAIAILMNETDDLAPEDCTLVYPALKFSDMAEDVRLASRDYLNSNVTETARFGDLFGCMPVFIGQAARRAGHGRLEDNKAYVFIRSAIGLAEGVTERLGVVEWVPQKRSWLIGAEANAGATRINNGGIVEIDLQP